MEYLTWSFLYISVICTLILNCILRQENVRRRRRSVLKKYISFWIAISITLFYQSDRHNATPTTKLVLYLETDGTLTNYSDHIKSLPNSKKPVILITTTDYSAIQTALLTSLGQALYPVRDKLIWIVVSLPLESSDENEKVVDTSNDNLTFGEAVEMQADLTKSHLRFLKGFLVRFGIRFFVVRSYEHRQLNATWDGIKWPKVTDRILKGYEAGLWLALKSLSRGVLVLGDVQFTYDSALFAELQDTKIASTWPIGLINPWNTSEIATPIFMINEEVDGNKLTRLIGYKEGSTIRNGSILIGRGSFAIDLEYFRTRVPFEDQWKLCVDRGTTNTDFKIEMTDIQVMGKQGSEIYMWRTGTRGMYWPDYLKVRKMKKNLFTENTNIKKLLENAFGPRYYLIRELIVEDVNRTQYVDYDFDNDVAIYINDTITWDETGAVKTLFI